MTTEENAFKAIAETLQAFSQNLASTGEVIKSMSRVMQDQERRIEGIQEMLTELLPNFIVTNNERVENDKTVAELLQRLSERIDYLEEV